MSKMWYSEFSSDVPIAIIDRDDDRYSLLKPLFEIYGYGFVDMKSSIVFIDGGVGLDSDELKWVEAHEVAHILSGSVDEMETDLMAYGMLLDRGYHRSAELVLEHLERHSI